ncbi:hypothetical protein [Ruminococcus sp.]|uniref:hypothetical protein n=1 Tax=Ruminococcus sp. TaxID=41978 RepID=UPI0025D9CFB1|nr:hypothetical protein [Ruminococcus sp.]
MEKVISHGFIALKPEKISELSLEAYGVLSMMVNDPGCDYVTLQELHHLSPKDSISTIKSAVRELQEKNWIFETVDEKYIVNKEKMILSMTYICANISRAARMV